MTSNELMLADNDYVKLHAVLNRPNIFVCSGSSQYEIRHSNFIAWLLNPNESHKEKDLFLRAFVSSIGKELPLNLDKFEILRESKYNIDLFLRYGKTILVIENKIKAKDSTGQLLKYRTKIQSEYEDHEISFIYWTLHGDDPVDIVEGINWQRYSYEDFVLVLESIVSKINDQKIIMYVEDYIHALKVDHLKSSEYVKWAKAIIEKHKSTLPKIFNHFEYFRFEDKLTLSFLMKNSSYVKGNGFFSQEKPYLHAFTRACVTNGYDVIPPKSGKQSTYFSFVPKSADKALTYFGFSIRFYELKNCLEVVFGVGPETPSNKRIRDIILQNRNEFGVLNSVKSKGEHHIGIVKKEILFNPLDTDPKNINDVITNIFHTEINDFTDQVMNILKKITR